MVLMGRFYIFFWLTREMERGAMLWFIEFFHLGSLGVFNSWGCFFFFSGMVSFLRAYECDGEMEALMKGQYLCKS